MPSVTFYGACGVVTGSCTHLQWGENQALVDCGLYQGGEELELRNWRPFQALEVAIGEELGWPRPVLPLTGDSVPW